MKKLMKVDDRSLLLTENWTAAFLHAISTENFLIEIPGQGYSSCLAGLVRDHLGDGAIAEIANVTGRAFALPYGVRVEDGASYAVEILKYLDGQLDENAKKDLKSYISSLPEAEAFTRKFYDYDDNIIFSIPQNFDDVVKYMETMMSEMRMKNEVAAIEDFRDELYEGSSLGM